MRAELDKAGKAIDELYLQNRGKLVFFAVIAALVWGIVCAFRTRRVSGVVSLLVLLLVGLILGGMLLPALSICLEIFRQIPANHAANLSLLFKFPISRQATAKTSCAASSARSLSASIEYANPTIGL